MEANLPLDETLRLKALHDLQIMDSTPETHYDDLVKLAANICDTPMAAISLVDECRQWFKASVGVPLPEIPRKIAFCAHTILSSEPLIVANALLDERFYDNPLVTEPPGVRFYAGVPLISNEGHCYGALCVIDTQAKELSAEKIEALKVLARSAVALFELRKSLIDLRAQRIEKTGAIQDRDYILKSFFDSSPIMMGTVEFDESENIVALSQNQAVNIFFERIATQEEKISIEDMQVGEDDLAMWKKHYRQSLETGHPIEFIYQQKTHQGNMLWFEAVVNVIRHDGPRPRFSYITRDVTEDLKSQETIREQKHALESILNAIPIGIVIFDKHFKCEWINPAFQSILSWSIADLNQTGSFDRMFSSKALSLQAWKHFKEAKSEWKFFETLTKTIHPIPILWSVVKITDGKIVAFAKDMSEEKIQQAIIDEQKMKIHHSARLSSLGEMAAGIAHEINNPLAIIKGNAQVMEIELAKKGLDLDRLGRNLDSINSTVARIAKIIGGLQLLARDGTQDKPLPTSAINLVLSTLELTKSRMKLGGVELITELPTQDVMVECRSAQISQVLINLLNNAFDAVTEVNPKWIRVSLAHNGEHAIFRISDSGLGIPDSIKEKIMQPFFTTKDPGKGTGLGLSLSNTLIRGHGGTFELERDSPNTIFKIVLPLHSAQINSH